MVRSTGSHCNCTNKLFASIPHTHTRHKDHFTINTSSKASTLHLDMILKHWCAQNMDADSPSLILAMSTLALFSCRAVWSAGRSWRSRVGSCSSGGAGDCRTGDTGTVDADEPGGPDEGFKLPEPEDDDWDWEPRVAAGFSTCADSAEAAERRRWFHKLELSHKSYSSAW